MNQYLPNPIGVGLALDRQHIDNQRGLMELAAKKQEMEIQNQTRQALADLSAPKQAPQESPSIRQANDLDTMIQFVQGEYDDFSKKARTLQAVNPKAADPFQDAADKRLTTLKDLQSKKIAQQKKRCKRWNPLPEP